MSERYRGLPLLEWTPACRLIAFPPNRQLGRIREVARHWLCQSNSQDADTYAIAVDDALQDRFTLLNILPDERQRLSEAFWNEVRAEIYRVKKHAPGGSAA